jgi:hypothetical protein
MVSIYRSRYTILSLLILSSPLFILSNESVQAKIKNSEYLKENAPGLIKVAETVNVEKVMELVTAVPDMWTRIGNAVADTVGSRDGYR